MSSFSRIRHEVGGGGFYGVKIMGSVLVRDVHALYFKVLIDLD